MVRIVFVPFNDKIWFDYYINQAKQSGHGLGGFQGVPYQRGNGLGSFFGRLFHSILPVAKRIGKSALKTIGQEALHMGTNVIGDLSDGTNVKESFKRRGLQATKNLINRAESVAKNQSGGRIGKRKAVSKVNPLPIKKQRIQKKKTKKNTDIFYNVKNY